MTVAPLQQSVALAKHGEKKTPSPYISGNCIEMAVAERPPGKNLAIPNVSRHEYSRQKKKRHEKVSRNYDANGYQKVGGHLAH